MAVENPTALSTMLLHWYDGHARQLPWRAPPGLPPTAAYRVWLSEIMLQQTQVATVIPYFARFVARWPSVEALAVTADDTVMTAWAGLGYYARARSLLTCARAVAARGGFPKDEAGLRALPGIGAYTAAAIASIAFGRRAVVVDGNVERVVARVFAIEQALPAARSELRRLADSITPQERCGDFAQAMMDLGATICTPRAPKCAACPLTGSCRAFASGEPAQYPRRLAKATKPERTATAWWIERDGNVLLVRRPDHGLLGGMRALPSTLVASSALPATAWASTGATLGVVTHVFTHFRLRLTVVATVLPGCNTSLGGEWWPRERLGEAGLPTLFAKAAQVAMRDR